jgi:hypothetical protein
LLPIVCVMKKVLIVAVSGACALAVAVPAIASARTPMPPASAHACAALYPNVETVWASHNTSCRIARAVERGPGGDPEGRHWWAGGLGPWSYHNSNTGTIQWFTAPGHHTVWTFSFYPRG